MGMSRDTGYRLDGIDHVRQSAIDVLSTVSGERVMRLDYGSRLLDSVDDAANNVGRARLLGRVADPLAQWEGDRLQLRRVDAVMREPGHAIVSVEGTTDEGELGIVRESLVVDPRLPASAISFESLLLVPGGPNGSTVTTTVEAALDNILLLASQVIVDTSWQIPVPLYVAPDIDTPNAAGVRYRGSNVQSRIDQLLASIYYGGVHNEPIVPPPWFNPPTVAPVTSPTPNAQAIPYDGTWSGVGGPLQNALIELEAVLSFILVGAH